MKRKVKNVYKCKKKEEKKKTYSANTTTQSKQSHKYTYSAVKIKFNK